MNILRRLNIKFYISDAAHIKKNDINIAEDLPFLLK